MLYISLEIVVWLLFMLAVFKFVDDDTFGSTLVLSSDVILIASLLITDYIVSKNDLKNCHETTKDVRPFIVHLSDSSKKILKFEDGGEIEIKREDPYFAVREDLIFYDPCSKKIIWKNP